MISKNYSINISTSPKSVDISLISGELTITIKSSIDELINLYNLRPSEINLSVLETIIKDNKVRILKTYNFHNTVEEWLSINGIFSFKKEGNLIVCVVIANNYDYIYLTEKDLKGDMRYTLTLKQYNKLKKIKQKEKIEAMNIARNISTTWDLGIGFFTD